MESSEGSGKWWKDSHAKAQHTLFSIDKALPCAFRWRLSFPRAAYHLMNYTVFSPLVLWQHSPSLLPSRIGQHSSEPEGPRNSDEATALSIPCPRALRRGLYHPGLELYVCFLPLLVESWWWPQPWEGCSAWGVASSVEEAMEQSEQGLTVGGCISPETLKCHKSEPHDAKKEEAPKPCIQSVSGWRLPRQGLRETNPGN